ncbi:uncharacterized protein EV420DRAFT_1673400 [Desarmillaria tabescens]|uniref:Uncharacterized protein n=1 Tax=Armillaria tabescens TaxID=1929756 RepID=A0AA39KHS2_ARMTA|nr:uncharacterized protein EV420DRAFT_1673400 [Desarmillaria tabescens]KAK0460226.1 hypothetical protein EV420DRAFT_1673400 [Desarmillaria tabescens]
MHRSCRAKVVQPHPESFTCVFHAEKPVSQAPVGLIRGCRTLASSTRKKKERAEIEKANTAKHPIHVFNVSTFNGWTGSWKVIDFNWPFHPVKASRPPQLTATVANAVSESLKITWEECGLYALFRRKDGDAVPFTGIKPTVSLKDTDDSVFAVIPSGQSVSALFDFASRMSYVIDIASNSDLPGYSVSLESASHTDVGFPVYIVSSNLNLHVEREKGAECSGGRGGSDRELEEPKRSEIPLLRVCLLGSGGDSDTRGSMDPGRAEGVRVGWGTKVVPQRGDESDTSDSTVKMDSVLWERNDGKVERKKNRAREEEGELSEVGNILSGVFVFGEEICLRKEHKLRVTVVNVLLEVFVLDLRMGLSRVRRTGSSGQRSTGVSTVKLLNKKGKSDSYGIMVVLSELATLIVARCSLKIYRAHKEIREDDPVKESLI